MAEEGDRILKEGGDFYTLEEAGGVILAEFALPPVQTKPPLIFGFQRRIPTLVIPIRKGATTFNNLFPIDKEIVIIWTMSKKANTIIPIRTQIITQPIIKEFFKKVGGSLFKTRYRTEGNVKFNAYQDTSRKSRRDKIMEFLSFLDRLDD